MIDEILEQQYVVSKSRTDLPELIETWNARSTDYRREADALIDQPYGDRERQRLDLFRCGNNDAPMLVYIHGGYWQRGDKSMYSYIARPFVERDVNVAVIGYPLCPQVSLTTLVASVRQALVYLYTHAGDLGIDRERINICGSSAGGHLVAMMMSTRWPEYGAGLPGDLVKFGVPVSGLYHLEPLRHTSLNEAIRMNEAEAESNSPREYKPGSKSPILITVGGAETKAFFTQMDGLVESWQAHAGVIDRHIEDGADHFDMIDRLGDSSSALFQQILGRLL